jgi:hypothetical protein
MVFGQLLRCVRVLPCSGCCCAIYPMILIHVYACRRGGMAAATPCVLAVFLGTIRSIDTARKARAVAHAAACAVSTQAEEAEVDVYSIPFSADTLVAHFAECIAAIDRIPHEPFLRGCTEVEKLMRTCASLLPPWSCCSPCIA